MNPFDILEKLEDPKNGEDLVLYLLSGRSAYRVFAAMEKVAPDEEALEALFATPEFLEMIDEVAVVFANIRQEIADLKKQGVVDTQKYVESVMSHHPQALDAAAAFAQLLQVSPADVVSVLMNA